MDELTPILQQKLEDITSISSKFEESQWRTRCESLERELDRAKTRIKELELKDSVVHQKTPEQVICEMEIAKLQETSMKRSLTLEETKRFDFLVKNLLLIKESEKEKEPVNTGPILNVTESALLAIAEQSNGTDSNN